MNVFAPPQDPILSHKPISSMTARPAGGRGARIPVRHVRRAAGRVAALLMALLTAGTASRAAEVTWLGAVDPFWSNPANWLGGPPEGGSVVFGNAGAGTDAGTTTSLVDQPGVIGSLAFRNSPGLFHHLRLLPGNDLVIRGEFEVATGTTNVLLAGLRTTIRTHSLRISQGGVALLPELTLAVTNELILGHWGTGVIGLAPGAGLHLGEPAAPITAYFGRSDWGRDAPGAGSFAPDSSLCPNVQLHFSALNLGWGSQKGTGTGTLDLSRYTGPLNIGNLRLGNNGLSAGYLTFGNPTLNRLVIPTVDVGNGTLTVNSPAVLTVTNELILGHWGTGTISLAPGAGLHLGEPAAPITAYFGRSDWGWDAPGSGAFAPDSLLSPDVQMHFSALNLGWGSQKGTGTGALDLSRYTGPLSIGNLRLGNNGLSAGHFTFGNPTLNRLVIPTVDVGSGTLTVNSPAVLAVTNELILGHWGTGAISLAPGAGLHLGEPAAPITAYFGRSDWGWDAPGSGAFAPDSALCPDVQLHFSTLNLGWGSQKGTGTGALDLSRYTGPLSIGNLRLGNNGISAGHFTFGNPTLNRLVIPTVDVGNGTLTVNSPAVLTVTNELILGHCGTGSISLAPGAGLHLGEAAAPITAYFGRSDWGWDAPGTGAFAPDSALCPDVQLHFATLNLGWGSSKGVGNGVLDLSRYSGPLTIRRLALGTHDLSSGHFTFGSPGLGSLRLDEVDATTGSLTLNPGAMLAAASNLKIGAGATAVVDVGLTGSGLSIENPSAAALNLAPAAGRLTLRFADPASPSEFYWGLRWQGDHVAQLAAWLEGGRYHGDGRIQAVTTGTALNLEDLVVALRDEGGVPFTMIGFPNALWRPARITTQPLSRVSRPGDPVSFEVEVEGTPPPRVQWRFNGVELPGATGLSLVLPAAGTPQAGSYDVAVWNLAGTNVSRASTLAFLDLRMFAGLIVDGPVGARYAIEYATELAPDQWHSLTNVQLALPHEVFVDYDSPDWPRRFYRALPQE